MPDPTVAAPVFDGVIAVVAGSDHTVGGLRLAERAALTLARAGARRLLCIGDSPSTSWRLPAVPVTWAPGARAVPAQWMNDASATIVVMHATTVTDAATVTALAAAPDASPLAASPPAVLWRTDPTTLSSLLHAGVGDLTAAPPSRARPWTPPAQGLLCTAHDDATRTDAERALYARLGRSGDGWFTRVVDRRLSRMITRLLLPTGVAPNTVTLASIAIGIAGGWCFAQGTPVAAIAGALLFLLSTIVDGCDGEIARLTFRESALGARLDILGDNLVHLFLFGGIATGLYRRSTDPAIATLGLVLVAGVVLSMATVYLCVVQRTPNRAQQTLFEAFASREFAYLLVALTLAGRLDWFLWLSAVGTYVFSIGLLALGRRPA